MHQPLRVRRSLIDLQREYEKGHKAPLETLMRAWKGIKALPPTDPNSFFVIGGFHGEPFRGAGWGNSSFWGGYCNHGNVLFPTWHRAYLLRLEDALRSIPGCEDVALPFWDETSEASQSEGIPWALTQETFELDGETIPNPLRSFVLTAPITDFISGDDPNYSKPQGYETVRYPLSGLVGTEADREATAAHNAQYPNYDENVALLNRNIRGWLSLAVIVNGKPLPTGVLKKYTSCLDAPNYTVFSNTTSAAQWNANLDKGARPVVPLESPHNSMHLAVGGYDVATGPNAGDFSPIPGANGDMGENDTAALDPIFYFHHCFVDRVFWLWQLKHGATDALEIIDQYPGTNSVDSQGPTPGVTPNSWLTLDSPLDPFKVTPGGRPTTSRDLINIETQLGYTYGPGSLMAEARPAALAATGRQQAPTPPGQARTVQISGINRAPVRGSFVVALYANIDGKRQLIDAEAVLSRWHVAGCANCQTHLEVKTFTGLHDLHGLSPEDGTFEVEIRTRDGQLSLSEAGEVVASAGKVARSARRLFRLELR